VLQQGGNEMKEPNRYDVTAAIAAMLVATEGADLRAILADKSDIPEDRLDFALSELEQGLVNIKGMVATLEALNGEPLSEETLNFMLKGGTWIDDTKGEGRYTVEAVLEEGNRETVAEVSVKTKLN
jgi:hypothetical protein